MKFKLKAENHPGLVAWYLLPTIRFDWFKGSGFIELAFLKYDIQFLFFKGGKK